MYLTSLTLKELNMAETLEIAASEFKAKCLELFDQLAARKLNRVVVTKRGRAVAVLTPPPTPEEIAYAQAGLVAAISC